MGIDKVFRLGARLFSAMSNNHKILVVCGPSGCGKSTYLSRLFAEYPNKFGFSVSHTTRKPRPGEEDGVHYHFSQKEVVEKMIADGKFLESATYSGNIYGTSLESVENVNSQGKICVLDIEIEGVKQVKQKNLDLILIFVQPPSLEELEKRLRNRGTETEDSLKKRLERSVVEMEYGKTPGNFDIVIVNDDLDKSYAVFKNFIQDELKKRGVNLDS